MNSKYLTLSNQQTLHYVIENENSADEEAIVLIHGNFSALSWWLEIIEGLKVTNKRIIAFDLRGFGKSSYLTKCVCFGDWAKDVIQALELLKIKKIVLNGWSFGGAISQKICQLKPELVTKLILTCTVSYQGLPLVNEDKVCKSQQEIQKIPKIAGALGILSTKNTEAMRMVFNMLLYNKMNHVDEKRKEDLALCPFDQRCYLELLVALGNSDINVNLIKAPTLIIHGSEDAVIPIQTILGTAAKLGKLDIWQGHSHMIPLEDTQKYLSIVKNFIS